MVHGSSVIFWHEPAEPKNQRLALQAALRDVRRSLARISERRPPANDERENPDVIDIPVLLAAGK